MNINEWINPQIIENRERFRTDFLKALFFEHISINNFLVEEKVEKLLEAISQEDYYIEENDLYKISRTVDFKTLQTQKVSKDLGIVSKKNSLNSKNKIISDFRDFLLSEEFISFIEDMTNSQIKRNKMDLHSLKLENTNYLLCHDDQVQKRQFAFIFNLSKDWKKEFGGELELFESDKDNNVLPKIFKSITPNFNQFNMFKVSGNSFHQVSEVVGDKPRVSISGWYYV